MKKLYRAFTLAEVLITLGIIGVVAAMTIPGLMTNLQHKHTAAKLKKFYSTMKQVIMQAEEEFGDIGSWEKRAGYTEFAQTYLAPYMKFTIENNGTGNTLDLLDGTQMIFYLGQCMDIYLDVNGKNKPNTLGYDRFAFLACNSSTSSGSTITSSYYCGSDEISFCTYMDENIRLKNPTRETYLNKCKKSGKYCTALIEYDGWTFQDDYPYK